MLLGFRGLGVFGFLMVSSKGIRLRVLGAKLNLGFRALGFM